jgi:hypothetical protein
MQTKEIILTIVIGTLISCQSNSDKSELAEFEVPQIINTQFNDSTKSIPYQAEFITEVFPSFVGKFKFQKEIDINPENRDTTIYKDFIEEYSRKRLTDSIDINGLELIVDYDNSVKYNRYYQYDSSLHDHYPVYFVNSTKTDKVFYGKDSYVFGIQEAVDKGKYGEWRPIEGRGFDFCGNGHNNAYSLWRVNGCQQGFRSVASFGFGGQESASKPPQAICKPLTFTVRSLEWKWRQ